MIIDINSLKYYNSHRKSVLSGHSTRSSIVIYFRWRQNKPIVLLKLKAFDGIESETRKKFWTLLIATIGCVWRLLPSIISILPRSKFFSHRRIWISYKLVVNIEASVVWFQKFYMTPSCSNNTVSEIIILCMYSIDQNS